MKGASVTALENTLTLDEIARATGGVVAAVAPAADMPSSSTPKRCSGPRRNRVRGSPYWLFRLPSVFSTGPWVPRRAAVISLVVVLPAEPVTATTGMAALRRT